MQVTKAVIPVAGLGTRFLPASKAIPKEMATVVDRPVIDYVVQEAVQAGIKHIVLVTSAAKTAIEDYFDVNYELEDSLRQKGKLDLLQSIQNIVPNDVTISAVRQGKPLGLGHAVLCAQPLIGTEPFAVLLADVLLAAEQANGLQQMLANYQAAMRSQIMVEAVAAELVDQYGIVDLSQQQLLGGQMAPIKAIIEKPKVGQAPSNFAVVGRYVLSNRFFSLLAQTKAGVGGEIQLTDAIAKLIELETVQAYAMQSISFDCGSKAGYLQATMHYAAQHPQLKQLFRQLITNYKTEM